MKGMHSPHELLSKFVVTTLGGLVLVAGLTLAATDWIVSEFAREDGEVHNKMVARAVSNALDDELLAWLRSDVTDPQAAEAHPAYRRLDAGVERVIEGLPVWKVKVFRPDGTIVYGTGLDGVGDRTPHDNTAFWNAVAGTAYSEVEFNEDFVDAEGNAFFRDAVASYLPLTLDGEVVGVFEIYGDYDYVLRLAEEYFPKIAMLVLAACLLLYGIVTLFVWRAQRDLTRARDDLATAHTHAESASQAKSAFLANMSHELRTPLNAILGFSEVMEGERFGPLGSDKYREYARDIRLSGQHLRSLIDDVLDMAKIEAGRVELELAHFDLRALIEETARMVKGRIDEAGQTLAIDLPDGPVWVRSDARLLRQVALNLLSNASKFTPRGGDLELGLQATDTALSIVVRDHGIGMSDKELAVARQPFGQAVRGRRFGHAGTGLGVPISISLTELIGGRLELHSRPDAGTTATVVLPLAAVRPTQVAPEAKRPTPQAAHPQSA